MLSTRKHLKRLIRSRDERAKTKSYCRDKQLVYFALIMGILELGARFPFSFTSIVFKLKKKKKILRVGSLGALIKEALQRPNKAATAAVLAYLQRRE